MSITVKQIAISKYSVCGEVVSRLSTALSIAKRTARELTELTGVPHSVCQDVWF